MRNPDNKLTSDEAMLVIESFLDLLEKYESVLLEITKTNLPKKIKDQAAEALAYGVELIDGQPD